MDRAPTWHKFNLQAFYPLRHKGDNFQVNPLITKGYTMDFDGDQANFIVPVTERGRQDAIKKMLPTKNLFVLTDLRSPRHTVTMENVSGVYALTKDPGMLAWATKPVRFESIEDLKKAYSEGVINAQTIIDLANS
jgi:DNA-directed RNA polymerase beta' subunit